MTTGPALYADVLGEGHLERDRLLAQAAALAPATDALLDELGIAEGWRAVDVGSGPLGILDLLSARVGSTGEVVGIEAIERFVEIGRQIADERGLANVRLVRADARASGLPAGSFDLVHERLVLIGPDRAAIARAMVDLARPGGLVVAQEVDVTTSFCEPAIPACRRLLEAFVAFVGRVGAEPDIGRRLGTVLGRAGVGDVATDIRARFEEPGSPRRAQMPALVGSAREGIVGAGILGGREIDELLAESRAHHADSATLVFAGLLFQSWGRTARRPTPRDVVDRGP